MSVLNQSGEEQVECPLCMEPLEVDDLNFFPCTCGYQVSLSQKIQIIYFMSINIASCICHAISDKLFVIFINLVLINKVIKRI